VITLTNLGILDIFYRCN